MCCGCGSPGTEKSLLTAKKVGPSEINKVRECHRHLKKNGANNFHVCVLVLLSVGWGHRKEVCVCVGSGVLRSGDGWLVGTDWEGGG